MDIMDFIKKNKDFTFFEKEATEIDILLFSQLSYLKMESSKFTNHQKYTLFETKQMLSRFKKKKDVHSNLSPFELLDILSTTKRYKEIKLSAYVYEKTDTSQFGAVTIELPNNQVFISFEGTDLTIAGWYEDAAMSFLYPTEAQKKAGNYLKEALAIYRKVWVCGHSKGGNLAIVGSMRVPILKRNKIVAIYSFDGPGVKEEEYNTLLYKSIKNKIRKYIPEQSLIGTLFKQDQKIVIKSKNKGIWQHDVTSWLVEGNFLNRGRQSTLSKELERTFALWLEKYNLKERKRIVDSLFSLFSASEITSFYEISKDNIYSLYRLVNATMDLDDETKKMLFTCLYALLGEFGATILQEEKEKIQNLLKK